LIADGLATSFGAPTKAHSKSCVPSARFTQGQNFLMVVRIECKETMLNTKARLGSDFFTLS
jgi:hypothetical protein